MTSERKEPEPATSTSSTTTTAKKRISIASNAPESVFEVHSVTNASQAPTKAKTTRKRPKSTKRRRHSDAQQQTTATKSNKKSSNRRKSPPTDPIELISIANPSLVLSELYQSARNQRIQFLSSEESRSALLSREMYRKSNAQSKNKKQIRKRKRSASVTGASALRRNSTVTSTRHSREGSVMSNSTMNASGLQTPTSNSPVKKRPQSAVVRPTRARNASSAAGPNSSKMTRPYSASHSSRKSSMRRQSALSEHSIRFDDPNDLTAAVSSPSAHVTSTATTYRTPVHVKKHMPTAEELGLIRIRRFKDPLFEKALRSMSGKSSTQRPSRNASARKRPNSASAAGKKKSNRRRHSDAPPASSSWRELYSPMFSPQNALHGTHAQTYLRERIEKKVAKEEGQSTGRNGKNSAVRRRPWSTSGVRRQSAPSTG